MILPPNTVSEVQPLASALLATAVVHTFCCKYINRLALRCRPGSAAGKVLHGLGEVEMVFALWAAILLVVWVARFGADPAIAYVRSVSYTEALFVFVIMTMAATRPVLYAAHIAIQSVARWLPLPSTIGLFLVTLVLGPLLGSFITEPAAMTVTALVLRDLIFERGASLRLKYATLGLLFVNVSIGGTLTHFAAPPVLMVATPWSWTSSFMLAHFGWKAAVVIVIGTSLTAFAFRRELASLAPAQKSAEPARVPHAIMAAHLLLVAIVIANVHAAASVAVLFLVFLGWWWVTRTHQEGLRLKESALVGCFLAGLVTLGGLQDWWLKPLLADLNDGALFWGSLCLTAIMDNAAITYLGTLVPTLDAVGRFLLVAGAVSGGGLTVIANAPNPAGFGILSPSFGTDGVSPLGLFFGALPYTLLAAAVFLAF